MLYAECCLVIGLRLARIRFSACSVIGYARVFVLAYTLRCHCHNKQVSKAAGNDRTVTCVCKSGET